MTYQPPRTRPPRPPAGRSATGSLLLDAFVFEAWPIRARSLRYGLALVAVGLVWIFREHLLPEAGDRSPFLAFGLAVMATAFLGGFGPGLLATLVSAGIAAFLYLPPQHALEVLEPFDTVLLSLFVLEGLAGATAGAFVRRAVLREEARSQSVNRFARLLERGEIVRERRPASTAYLARALTERERDVARLLVFGLGTDEIATALFVSRNTVKTHLKHIYEKLGVRTRAEAVARCIELGLLGSPIGPDAGFEADGNLASREPPSRH